MIITGAGVRPAFLSGRDNKMKHSIIPLFIPHYGCPHQCVFCNQVRITGQTTPVTAEDVERQIERYLSSARDERYWEAAFYGGSFTALPLSVMEALLRPAEKALRAGKIRGIRLSTRPDCISDAVLRLLKASGVSIVELGAQSLDDKILQQAERGHTAGDVEAAVRLLRAYGFGVGLQFMAGLPGETAASIRRTARRGAALRPDFVRLYPALILRGTKLFRLYKKREYTPLSVREAVYWCAFLKNWYGAHQIPVIRTGLQATEELDAGDSLAGGPYHPAMGELTDQYLARHFLFRALKRLRPFTFCRISFHPRDFSKMTGYRKETKRQAEEVFGGCARWSTDPALHEGCVRIETERDALEITIYKTAK